ncbi:hypothetical protein D9M68_941140 [compost metagenome]
MGNGGVAGAFGIRHVVSYFCATRNLMRYTNYSRACHSALQGREYLHREPAGTAPGAAPAHHQARSDGSVSPIRASAPSVKGSTSRTAPSRYGSALRAATLRNCSSTSRPGCERCADPAEGIEPCAARAPSV